MGLTKQQIDAYLKRMIQKLDTDGDGKLSYGEFVRWHMYKDDEDMEVEEKVQVSEVSEEKQVRGNDKEVAEAKRSRPATKESKSRVKEVAVEQIVMQPLMEE